MVTHHLRQQILTALLVSGVLGLLVVFSSIAGCTITSAGTSVPSNSSDPPVTSDQPVTIVDSLNRTVTFPHIPQRIIAANQGAVPLLIVLGGGDRIVGVPSFVLADDNLARHLPNAQVFAGSLQKVNCEQILALQPDVIIEYVKYPPTCNDRLEDSGIPVLYFNSFDLTEIRNASLQMGTLTGNTEKADNYIGFIDQYQSLTESRIANFSGPAPRVYLEYSTDYMTYGKNSQGEALLSNLHADNIARSIDMEFPTISPEWILQQDPDVIIKLVSSTSMRASTTTLQKSYQDLVSRPGFSNLSAVRNHRVYVISSDLVYYTRQPVGSLYLAKMIYPYPFSDIDPDQILHAYASRFQVYADNIPTVYPPFSSK
jgi:iron complex transport system substrate-binding protein